MTDVVVNSCSCPNSGAQGHVPTCPQASDLDRLRGENKRLRGALEQIADCDCHAADTAKDALG